MRTRQLGIRGPIVSALGLGCMGMSEFYGASDIAASEKLIQLAYKNGVTLFDTADMYGKGANEELVGRAIASFRENIILATKCGITFQDYSVNNSRAYILQACADSLRRLNTPYIDIYYLHRVNPNTPIKESMEAMQQLLQEGKIKYVGLSEVSADVIRQAHAILGDKLVAVQSEYSLVNRIAAEQVLPTCQELGIGFVPYSPIARGLLSGQYTQPTVFAESKTFDFRSVLPQFQPENIDVNLRLVTALKAIAAEKNCTAAQISLAWLLAQHGSIVPIPGTRREQYLLENIASANIALTSDDLARIEKACVQNPIQGTRLPEVLMTKFNMKQ